MVMANPQTAKLFGYECDELIGKPVDLLVPVPHLDSHASLGARAFTSPESHGVAPLHETSARRKDGTEFRVEIGLNAFRFGNDDSRNDSDNDNDNDSDGVTLAFIIDRTDR